MPDGLSQIDVVRSAGELVRDALRELKPVKGNLPVSIGVSVISLVLSLNILNEPNTVELIVNISTTLNNVFLGLFGVALSIFAIFFSLLNGEYVRGLASQEGNPLLKYLRYYENALVLFAVAFTLSLLISLLDQATIYKMTAMICCDYYVEAVICFMYLALSFRIVCETKSLLFNTFAFTRAYICLKGCEGMPKIQSDAASKL